MLLKHILTNANPTDLRFSVDQNGAVTFQPDYPLIDRERILAAIVTYNPLADAMATAQAAIDQAAESNRLRYITGGAGQAATYLLKREQAKAFAAAGFIGPVPSMIAARVAATGQNPQQAAETILATADAWEIKAAQIEQARETGKAQVGAAMDVAGVEAARDAALAALAVV